MLYVGFTLGFHPDSKVRTSLYTIINSIVLESIAEQVSFEWSQLSREDFRSSTD